MNFISLNGRGQYLIDVDRGHPHLVIKCLEKRIFLFTNGATPTLGGECKIYTSFPNIALDDVDNIDSRSQYYESTSSD